MNTTCHPAQQLPRTILRAVLLAVPLLIAFRIKIWNVATGGVVYDNKMGGAENGDDATLLGDNGQGGGSIVIHDDNRK